MASMAVAISCQRAHEVRYCSGKNSPKRRKDHVGFHTHYAESNVYGVSRRRLLALSMCTVTKVCVESWVFEYQGKACAAEDDNTAQNDKSSNNIDGTSQAHAESLESKPDSPLNGLLSLFDTNEKSKSGKLLPKGYLRSARQVVKSLKESLKEESGKEADVRRSADSAKEAIRNYLQSWRGQKVIESEDSYKALEGALKVLGKFYAKQGPRAVLPSDVKSQILMDLELADAAL